MFRASILGATLGVALLAVVAPAPAHERRAVGRVETVVGWLNEPAFAGAPNGVSFRATRSGAGVTGASLKADVTFEGADTLTLTLAPAFGDPGHYEAHLIPTRPGTYTFRIYGRLAGGSFNQTYRSGETTFDDIQATADVEYPEKDPSRDELARRAEQQQTRIAALQRDASDARSAASLARILSIVALGIAIASLVFGRRRGARA